MIPFFRLMWFTSHNYISKKYKKQAGRKILEYHTAAAMQLNFLLFQMSIIILTGYHYNSIKRLKFWQCPRL